MNISNLKEATQPHLGMFLSDIENFKTVISERLPSTYEVGEIKKFIKNEEFYYSFPITKKEEKYGSLCIRIRVNTEGLISCSFFTNIPELYNGSADYRGVCPIQTLKDNLTEVAFNNFDTWQPAEVFLKDIFSAIVIWLQND